MTPTATSNVFSLCDSTSGTVYAVVVDAANPPGVGSANNTYWNTAITTVNGHSVVAIPIDLITYNATSNMSALLTLINVLFNTLGVSITL